MKFKVHLLKNHKQNHAKAGISIPGLLEDLRLRFQIHYWGLAPAFSGEGIARVRLNCKDSSRAKVTGYDYELNLFGEDYQAMLDIYLGRIKKQFAVAGIGLISFGALLGIGSGKAEAVQKSSMPATSNDKAKVSTPAVSHTQVETFLQEVYPGEYSLEKFRLVYYHNNVSAHVNTQDSHVNTAHVNNNHSNSWTNASSHQNQWNNSPHQNTPGGVHTNSHVNAIPGDYIY